MATLYERIGGKAAVEMAVNQFYLRVLADRFISPFFEGVDIQEQIVKQTDFLTLAFGGADRYRGRDMRGAHRKLVEEMGMNDMHFDQVLAHLRTTLAELGASMEIIAEVNGIAESTRKDVMNR